MQALSWVLYIIGTVLVFGNWIGLVPTDIAWLGWLAAMVGWLIGNARSRKHNRNNEAAAPEDMRHSGTSADDEYRKTLDRIVRR